MSGIGKGPFWIDPFDETAGFPDVSLALREPDGLLAVGGSLTPKRLIDAYRKGVFPWYSEGQPILWWSPDPRAVLRPGNIKISRSMRKLIRKQEFSISFDRNFRAVVQNCAMPRGDGNGTWLTGEMINAYIRLHDLGFAHSVECWSGEQLLGGLYGVALGKVFFGESMFSRAANTSKLAFIYLACQLEQWGFALIDCQVQSQHLRSLGAEDLPRNVFTAQLARWCKEPGPGSPWHLEIDAHHILQRREQGVA